MYLNLSQLGIGREIKEKLSESFNFGNKMSLLPVYSPVRITRKDSIKKTIRITQQELDRKVNQAMIRYYEKFMTEIPNLLKEIEEIKTLSDEKEKEYIEYMDKVK